MRLKSIYGKAQYKNVSKKRVKWDAASKSKFQREVKNLLYKKWKLDVVYEEFPVYGSLLTLDFFNSSKMIAIEVQGTHHTEFNKFFHKSRYDYLAQLQKDEEKRKFCDLNGIRLVEIFYEEKKELSSDFLDTLGL